MQLLCKTSFVTRLRICMQQTALSETTKKEKEKQENKTNLLSN